MNKESILYGVVGLMAGVIFAGFSASYAVNNNNQGMMRMMGMGRHITNDNELGMMKNDEMSMTQMTNMLRDKTGDEFDKAFIEQMIAHHQGAIDMADLAKKNAKHDEIRQMADDIISAQSKEINMMRSWQSQWGYSSESHNMMKMMEH